MSLFSIIAKIRLDGAKETHDDLQQTEKGAEKATRSFVNMGNVLKGLENVAKGLHRALTIAFTATSTAALAAEASAFRAYTSYESLTRGLATTVQTSEQLLAVQSRIRELAKLPGLGEQEAGQAYLTLRSAGLSADLSTRSIAAFGNALASVGKGKEELDGVIIALSQIQSKGVVSAEEINQIAERVPQVRRLLAQAFGTADTQQIQKLGLTSAQAIEKIVQAAEKLPRASGGIRNDIENFQDTIERAQRPLGQGIAIALQAAAPFVDRVLGGIERTATRIGEVFAAVGQSGVLGEALSGITAGIESLDGWIINFIGNTLAFIKNFPTIAEDAAKYMEGVWETTTDNIGIFFRNTLERVKGYFTSTFNDIKATALQNIGEMLQSIPHLPGAPSGTFAAGQKMLDQAARLRQPAPPTSLENYKPLPDFGKYSPFRGADEFIERIVNAQKRLPKLPDNLSFAGPESPSASGNQTANKALESLLAQIEKNTAKTSKALEDRRVDGGGEIARMGITGAELSMMRNPGPDPYTRSVNAQLEDAIRRVQISTQQRLNRRNLALYGR